MRKGTDFQQHTTATQDDVNFNELVANGIEVDANGGNGGASDEEGDECILHSKAIIPPQSITEEDDVDYLVNDRGDFKGLVQFTNTGNSNVIGSIILGEDGSKTIDAEDGDGTGPKEVKIAGEALGCE